MISESLKILLYERYFYAYRHSWEILWEIERERWPEKRWQKKSKISQIQKGKMRCKVDFSEIWGFLFFEDKSEDQLIILRESWNFISWEDFVWNTWNLSFLKFLFLWHSIYTNPCMARFRSIYFYLSFKFA